jgi:hypothetical protein
VSGQPAFDADIERAMTRRQFLTRLAGAASAAVVVSGCGSLRGQLERQRLGAAAPVFNPVQREVVAKIIDGFNPPDSPLRRQLAREDPDYDAVEAFGTFAAAHGDEFLSSMTVLIDFLNVLPGFTRTFATRHGLPARLQLRYFHAEDAERYFLFLRDSSVRPLRTIFSGARFIATAPIYTNEKVTWKAMGYPGPWLRDPDRRTADLAEATSFELAKETDDSVAVLRRRVIAHDALRTGVEAARIVAGTDRLVLETDVVVVGSGAGGSFVAAELAARTDQRILILEKGEFLEPDEFLQRERLMMPRIFDTEFSVLELFGVEVPTVSTAIVTGKLVGGSATINHALAFEPPRPVIRDWREQLGADLDYDDLAPHLEAIRTLLRIAPVAEAQISGSNLALRRGALAPRRAASRPRAAQRAPVHRLRLLRSRLPLQSQADAAERRAADGGAAGRPGPPGLPRRRAAARAAARRRPRRRARTCDRPSSPALTDSRGTSAERTRSARAAWCSPAARSRRPRPAAAAAGRPLRRLTGRRAGRWRRDSRRTRPSRCTATSTSPLSVGGHAPMGYFVKKYEVQDQATADPARDHVRYALEGLLNHPLAHAQLMPYESAESYQAFMKAVQPDQDAGADVSRPAGRARHAERLRVHAGRGGSCRVAGGAADWRAHHVRRRGRRVFFNAHRR